MPEDTRGAMARVLSAKPETVFIDKYSGAEFTAAEVAQLVSPMIHTDTKETIDEFCERFEVKPSV